MTDLRAAERPLPVASRNLLEGILTVKRRDLLGSSKFNGNRETEIDADADATARVRLVDLVDILASGSVGSVPRDRWERRSSMIVKIDEERK